MLQIFAAIGSFLGGPITAITGQVAGYFTSAKTIEGSEFTAMTTAQQEMYIAGLKAQTDLNTAKVSNRNWATTLLMLAFGIPPALHMGAVYFVSAFPSLGWKVAAVPAVFADSEFKIALSFFILAPVYQFGGPLFAGLASRLRA